MTLTMTGRYRFQFHTPLEILLLLLLLYHLLLLISFTEGPKVSNLKQTMFLQYITMQLFYVSIYVTRKLNCRDKSCILLH